MIEITSKQNPILKLVNSLKKRKGRDKAGLFVLEGKRGLLESIQSDFLIKNFILSDTFSKQSEAVDIINQLPINSEVIKVSDNVFKQISTTESPQGILFIAEQKKYCIDDILNAKQKFIVIADEIQDPGNLGTIIRTTAAANASGLILTRGCVDIYNQKVIRSTMGGFFKLPIVYIDNNVLFIEQLKKIGFSIVVADINGNCKYYDSDLTKNVAIVLGNENQGPSLEFLNSADQVLNIPLLGTVESLNVSIAAGILIYEVVRQRKM